MTGTGSVSTRTGGIFEPNRLKDRIDELNKRMAEPDFWTDQENAEKTGKEKTTLEQQLTWFTDRENDLEELSILIELLDEGDSDASVEIEEKVKRLEQEFSSMETRRMLSGPDDRRPAIVQINAGAGGTEAQDWAEMLFRM